MLEYFSTFALVFPPYFCYNGLRYKMRKQQLTNEQKIAVKMAQLLDSVSLDLDRVGIEVARLEPKTIYNRLMLVAESAVEEREIDHDRYNQHSLFR
jgi:hypothetical protein